MQNIHFLLVDEKQNSFIFLNVNENLQGITTQSVQFEFGDLCNSAKIYPFYKIKLHLNNIVKLY